MKRIPADKKQCQVEIPDGTNFMTLGGVANPAAGRRVRCTNKPTMIVFQTKPDKLDGKKGSMSMCDSCFEVFKKQVGLRGHKVKKLTK